MFCHHVIAVFEHLRLDRIPEKYILKRYSKNPVQDPDFNRRDYKDSRMLNPTGTTLEYRRIVLYNEAMKTVNNGLTNDIAFEIALAAFREVNARIETGNRDRESGDRDSNETENIQDGDEEPRGSGSSDEPKTSEQANNSDAYADILPPNMSKTKGSGNTTTASKKETAEKSTTTRPEPAVDENGKPLGKRLCSNCNKIEGHNARSCKKKQLAKMLLEAHQKQYGNTMPPEKVKAWIRNLLAKQQFNEEEVEEETLDTDEEEDYEDNTDEEENEEQDTETEEQSESERSIDESKEQTSTPPYPPRYNDLNLDENRLHIPSGKVTCSICKKKEKHNARSCPMKEEILRRQTAEKQQSSSVTMDRKGVRTCGDCGLIEGHNARSCKRLQMEKQLLEKLKSTQADTPKQTGPRRSSRLKIAETEM